MRNDSVRCLYQFQVVISRHSFICPLMPPPEVVAEVARDPFQQFSKIIPFVIAMMVIPSM